MLSAIGAVSGGFAAALGALVGLAVLAATYGLNAYVRAGYASTVRDGQKTR